MVSVPVEFVQLGILVTFALAIGVVVGGAYVFLLGLRGRLTDQRVRKIVKFVKYSGVLFVSAILAGTLYTTIDGTRKITINVHLQNVGTEGLKNVKVWTDYNNSVLKFAGNNTWKFLVEKRHVRNADVFVYASGYVGNQAKYGITLIQNISIKHDSSDIDISLENAVPAQGVVVNQSGQGVRSTVSLTTKGESGDIDFIQQARTDDSGAFSFFLPPGRISPDTKIEIETFPTGRSQYFTLRDFPVKLVIEDR